jgi:hypothetical protein
MCRGAHDAIEDTTSSCERGKPTTILLTAPWHLSWDAFHRGSHHRRICGNPQSKRCSAVATRRSHIALGIAWARWWRSPLRSRAPSLRTILMFSGLLACSLSITVFWVNAIWMNVHRADLSLWKLSGTLEEVCDLLNGFAILAGTVGQGRAQLSLLFAAVAAWAMWITGHIGIL